MEFSHLNIEWPANQRDRTNIPLGWNKEPPAGNTLSAYPDSHYVYDVLFLIEASLTQEDQVKLKEARSDGRSL